MLTWPGEVAFESSVGGGGMTKGYPGSTGDRGEGPENWDPVPEVRGPGWGRITARLGFARRYLPGKRKAVSQDPSPLFFRGSGGADGSVSPSV